MNETKFRGHGANDRLTDELIEAQARAAKLSAKLLDAEDYICELELERIQLQKELRELRCTMEPN